jgi:hypothetical protein
VLANIAAIAKPANPELVEKVKEIIGDQQRVSWSNT